MKKILCLIAFPVLCALHLQAQPKNASSLLWEISGNGLQTPSYIFGTFHIMCKDDFEVSDILKNKIATAKLFYGELNMDEVGMDLKLASKMMMPDKSIESMIGAKKYPAVSEGFQKIAGMSLQMLDHFKPFMATSLLAMNSLACKEKIQPETEFVKIAHTYKVPLRGLETIDEQVAVIDKEPLDSQVHELVESVLKYDSIKNMMTKMLQVYKRRNIDSLYRFIKTSGTDGDFEMNMLVTRNRKWVPLIEKAVAEGPVFFAVGAGHLGGTEGIISLLRKRGYRLTPINY